MAYKLLRYKIQLRAWRYPSSCLFSHCVGVGLRYAHKATVHGEEWGIKVWTINIIPIGIEYVQLKSSWPWFSCEKQRREYCDGESLEVLPGQVIGG